MSTVPTAAAGRPLAVSAALAVVAHPDDESFGLGAVLAGLLDDGIQVTAVCFTHGEASTLGAERVDLRGVRARELADASRALGIGDVELLDYPDGRLAETPIGELADRVGEVADRHGAELLVVFDEGGVTGHPDHEHATRAALVTAARLDLPVLAWTVLEPVAAKLNAEFATAFVGRSSDQVDLTLTVDRARQLTAVACHRTQSHGNPVLWRRLELTGNREPLRWLRPPGSTSSRPVHDRHSASGGG